MKGELTLEEFATIVVPHRLEQVARELNQIFAPHGAKVALEEGPQK